MSSDQQNQKAKKIRRRRRTKIIGGFEEEGSDSKRGRVRVELSESFRRDIVSRRIKNH